MTIVNVNKYLADLKPYQVSESAKLGYQEKQKYAKMDWNEAAYPPSPHVISRLEEVLRQGALNYYPDVTATALRDKLSSYVSMDTSSIQVFNGSDGALRAICETFLNAGNQVLIRQPTYTQINTFIKSKGAKILGFTGNTPFTLDPEKFRQYLDQRDVAMAYIVNPNNPTGVMYSTSFIEELCVDYPHTLFLVDEAYYEYSGYTVADLTQSYNNIIVSRTFSKAFGLAGVRVGYILADPTLLNLIDLIRNGKNVNLMAQVGAIAALEDLPYMENQVDQVRSTRDWAYKELQKMGVEAYNTPANYLLIRVPDIERVIKSLEEKRILVRDRSSLPQLEGFFRVSIGTKEEMGKFLENFAAITCSQSCQGA